MRHGEMAESHVDIEYWFGVNKVKKERNNQTYRGNDKKRLIGLLV